MTTRLTKNVRLGRKGLASGLLCLALGALIVLVLRRGTDSQLSTFSLTSFRGGMTIKAPDLVVPASSALLFLGAVASLLGAWQLIRGTVRIGTLLATASAIGISAFLVWATRGKSLNLTGMLVSSIVRATPIALAALSGIYSERSGVVNIGIEGMMLTGAFLAAVVASISHNLIVGVFGGMAGGLALAALHSVLAIRFKVEQVISGTGIIILALGLTSYLQRAVLNLRPELNQPGPAMPAVAIPLLGKIPVLGPIVFNQSPIVYALIGLIAVTQFVLFQTRWGLRMRAVGEHPRAADTLGIDVFRTRYVCVLISGAIAGLAGAYMSIGSAGRFNEGMTAGKGFLGLAAMIFGNWNPAGSFIGSLIFGFFDSWQEKLAILQVGIPSDLLGMTPYIATMLVLAGVVGRARGPAASGQPYEKL